MGEQQQLMGGSFRVHWSLSLVSEGPQLWLSSFPWDVRFQAVVHEGKQPFFGLLADVLAFRSTCLGRLPCHFLFLQGYFTLVR